jgi:kynurenine formamidase
MSWSAPLVGPGLVVDLSRPIDLSVRVAFDDGAGRAFSLPGASTKPVLDVRTGGSCNCETHTFTPHGDGTHTEGVGHLLSERVSVVDLAPIGFVPALVVTVAPVLLESTTDEVAGNHAPDDRVVDELSLSEAIARALASSTAQVTPSALIVRTAPGHEQRARAFSGTNPTYFTADAAELLRARGIDHVVVDLPSLDREDDGGLLGAHRAFFDLAPRQASLHGVTPAKRTVTELAAVDDDVKDGAYALSLQVAPLTADAAPSRPILFPLVAASPSWIRS